MRSILLIFCGLLPAIAFAQKQASPYTLNAEVNFPKGDETGRTLYFVYQQNGELKTDSAIITNNKCTFNGRADLMVKTSLQFTKPNSTPEPALDPNSLSLYLNNGLTNVKATGFLSRAQVTGSAMQDEYAAFIKKYSRWDRTLTQAGRRKRNLPKTDTLRLKAVNKTIDSVQNIKMAELCLFLNNNIGKPYAVEAILMYLKAKGSSLDVHKANDYYSQLADEQKHSADGLEVEKTIADIKKHQ